MAHNVETMAYAGELPWHGLGKRVLPDLTPEQMMEEAGLNWTVKKVKAYARIGGKSVYVGQDALVRSSDNSILDTVSGAWNPNQNADAFAFFNEFIENASAEMHTAGSLQNGKIVWALAKVNESFELFKGDKIDAYLLFCNPHKFGQSIDVRFTPIRVVCNNTLTLSLSSKEDNQVRVTHRKVFDADKVKELMGIASNKLASYKEMATLLGSKRYTAESLIDYFNNVFPVITEKSDSKREMSKSGKAALVAIDEQPGRQFAPGSWWQAANAVTYVIDHKVGREADSRLASSWFGQNRQVKLRAMEKAVEFAMAA